jgi:hypothetical protein
MSQEGYCCSFHPAGGGMNYRVLSLTQLALRVKDGDRAALDEILKNRPLFHFGKKYKLLLSEFLYEVKQDFASRKMGGATEILDKAYDLVLDKFSNLPNGDSSGQEPVQEQVQDDARQQGADCRYYYSAFLKDVDKIAKTRPQPSPIGEEHLAGSCLQRFVVRHFHLSLKEARRNANPFVSRYLWEIKGSGKLTLWMPKSLYRQKRRMWLEENIENPNPQDPGERKRVQAIIDDRLIRPRFVPLEGCERCCAIDKALPMRASFDEKSKDIGLVVAKEKALSFRRQRPAIRRLGPARVEALVLSCFENALTREKSDEQLARKFGLSKSTFSRFAGSSWHHGTNGRQPKLPDLWANMAHVLATDPWFVKQVKTSRSRALIQAIAKVDRGRQLREATS